MAQQMKDAAVILSGLVIANDQRTVYETGEVTGRKVTVLATVDGESGIYNVNVSKDDMRMFNPTPGVDNVTIYVRSAAYQVEGNSGMSTRYLREVTDDDLEQIAQRIAAARALAVAGK